VEEEGEAAGHAVEFSDEHLGASGRAEELLTQRSFVRLHLVAQLLVVGELADEAEDVRHVVDRRRANVEGHGREIVLHTMAGYSGTPLPKKLGIKEGHRVLVLGAPEGFLPDVAFDTRASKASRNVIVFFTKSRAALVKKFDSLVAMLEPDGGLWVAWPKKASGVATDMTEDVVRALALSKGLVDNKVCAIDETWSGLRCVIRVENRKQ